MSEKQETVIAGFLNQIRRDISLGVLRPGERLVIEQLKRQHKISHPSVREALAQLVGEGYVSQQDQKGFKVLGVSLETLRDITRVRSELETLALSWSMENSDTDWRASVTAAHFALAEVEKEMVEDPLSYALEWDERNRNFHMALCANCGSPHLLSIIARQYDLTRRYRLMAHEKGKSTAARSSWMKESAKEHRLLKDAALAGDVDQVLDLLRGHVNKGSEAELVSIFDVKGNPNKTEARS